MRSNHKYALKNQLKRHPKQHNRRRTALFPIKKPRFHQSQLPKRSTINRIILQSRTKSAMLQRSRIPTPKPILKHPKKKTTNPPKNTKIRCFLKFNHTKS